jgi:hypothetical protein
MKLLRKLSRMKNVNGYKPNKDDVKVLVTLKDEGQDMTQLILAFYPDYGFGAVMDTDMQSEIWTKYFVLSGKPKKGDYLQISESPTSDVIQLKYQIERAQFVGRSTNWAWQGRNPS